MSTDIASPSAITTTIVATAAPPSNPPSTASNSERYKQYEFRTAGPVKITREGLLNFSGKTCKCSRGLLA
jgi:hypothetical protein